MVSFQLSFPYIYFYNCTTVLSYLVWTIREATVWTLEISKQSDLAFPTFHAVLIVDHGETTFDKGTSYGNVLLLVRVNAL